MKRQVVSEGCLFLGVYVCRECGEVLTLTPTGAVCWHGHGKLVPLTTHERKKQRQFYKLAAAYCGKGTPDKVAQ